MMDQGLKASKYKTYNVDEIPQAEIYNSPHAGNNWYGEAVAGVPLFPEETPGNPRLGRFIVQGYQDLWAALLFLATLVTTLVWGSVNLATYDPSVNSTAVVNPDTSVLDTGGLFLFLTVIFLISVVGACASLVLLSYFPRQLIFIANAITAVLALAAAVLCFITGVVFAGVLLLIMCGIQALWLYLVRDRIPFSAELLKASSGILMRYKAIFVFTVGLGIVSIVYVYFWGYSVFPVLNRLSSGEGNAGDGLLMVLFVLFFFWAAQVGSNVMHVTTAGVTATWYFAGEGQMPKNPTLASFKRAVTTSFGSICFGSLIVAFVRTIRWIAETTSNTENDFVRCIALCLISCLESAMEYFNTYAFVHVAVYGCGYVEAAKRTWQLCKQCFFAAYFNDALIGSTVSLLALSVSALIGIVVHLIYGSVALGVLAFLVALVLHVNFLFAVESAVTTLFVCFAEVPEGLQHSAPELYAAMHAADQNGTNNNAMAP
ncbi:Choline transporter-like [Trypanosoma melophagium]|uniref:Choline transporter-like n=1 Tax=Trypanosoma melophagium TaxID=715481 RepID=UPI00351A9A3A|nr:Choline transporter-like [Trypanosoma melophagium]KAH9582054.1 Choline transporter-like [Trypanosoma melophagium]